MDILETSKNLVNSWLHDSNNDFNKSVYGDVANENLEEKLTGNCSNVSCDLFSVSQQIQISSSSLSEERGFLSNWVHRNRKVYESCVKPTKKELKRRQLPQLFDGKSKRVLSESIRNLYKFIDDIDLTKVNKTMAAKKVFSPDSIDHFSIIKEDPFIGNSVLIPADEGTFTDSDWEENKSINGRNTLGKICVREEHVLRPIICSRKLIRNVYGTKASKTKPTTPLSPQLKISNFQENVCDGKRRITSSKVHEIINKQKVSKNVCVTVCYDGEIMKKKVLQQNVSTTWNNRIINDLIISDSNSKELNPCNNYNTCSQQNIEKHYVSVQRSLKFKNDSEAVDSLKQGNVFKKSSTPLIIINDNFKINENKNSITKDMTIETGFMNNCQIEKKNKVPVTTMKVRTSICNKSEFVKEASRRINVRTKVKKRKRKPTKIRPVMKRSILKSPGWSKLIDHMKELNILQEYKRNNEKNKKIFIKQNSHNTASKECCVVSISEQKSEKDTNLKTSVVRNENLTTKNTTKGTYSNAQPEDVENSQSSTNSIRHTVIFNGDTSNGCTTKCINLCANNVENQSETSLTSCSIISNSQPTQCRYFSTYFEHYGYINNTSSDESVIESSINLREPNYPCITCLAI